MLSTTEGKLTLNLKGEFRLRHGSDDWWRSRDRLATPDVMMTTPDDIRVCRHMCVRPRQESRKALGARKGGRVVILATATRNVITVEVGQWIENPVENSVSFRRHRRYIAHEVI